MKSDYQIIGRSTFPRERPEPSAPTVNFSAVTGVVYFSKAACSLLDLSTGDRVLIARDRRDPLKIGFFKTTDEEGLKVRAKRCGQCFTAARLVRNILPVFGTTSNKTVQLGTEPEDGIYWVLRSSVDKRTWAK